MYNLLSARYIRSESSPVKFEASRRDSEILRKSRMISRNCSEQAHILGESSGCDSLNAANLVLILSMRAHAGNTTLVSGIKAKRGSRPDRLALQRSALSWR